MREDGESQAPVLDRADLVTVRRADIGVISAFKLAGVLLGVLTLVGVPFWYVLRGEIERAVLLNNVSMADRYVSKVEEADLQARLSKRLDEIQAQLEQQRKLVEKVAIRLRVEP